MPFPKPGQDPYPAVQLAEVLKRHPKTTIIWAHCGLGRIVHPVKDQIGIVERALSDPRLAHLSIRHLVGRGGEVPRGHAGDDAGARPT